MEHNIPYLYKVYIVNVIKWTDIIKPQIQYIEM